MTPATSDSASRQRDGSAVDVLISVVACVATALFTLTALSTWHTISARPGPYASFLALTLCLQLITVNVYGRGTLSVAGIGFLAVAFSFGVGPAAVAGVATALMHGLRVRGRVHRAIFNAATWSLSAAAAAAVFELTSTGSSTNARVIPAIVAGAVLWALNVGAMSYAMSLADGSSNVVALWRKSFAWVTPYYLAFGPLALASTIAYEKMGWFGLAAFALPPALVMFAMQQYIKKTREDREEVQRANDELRLTNVELATRNADLHDLFEFAAGLAAQTHDGAALKSYAQESLERLLGGRARITVDSVSPGATPLTMGGREIGGLQVEGGDAERWERLRDAITPQLATALESANLVDEVRRTHLETIAALSRSMAAKDYYTGGHTERVSGIAVALARNLGYEGADLDAIEIGALLHDIGKIGIPERILHKPGDLDEDEWSVMRKHPVISEFILSEIALPPIVIEIARHTHERMDGHGYPDGLAGEAIPLAARVVLVADAFDALTSDRPYRRARSVTAAMQELVAHVGTQFCPKVIGALERIYREDISVLSPPEPLIVPS